MPGAFDAWMLLLRDHGTKSLADVLKYAVGYAEHGHPPVERVGETVATVRELFETEWTSSAEVYLPGGHPPRPGELFRNPALAATWKRLLAEVAGAGGREAQIEAARDVWRTGFVAEALVRQSARPTLDTSGEHHTGTLTADDLAAWSATYEDPVTYDFRGWTVCKAGPWSQGRRFSSNSPCSPTSCRRTARPPTCTCCSRTASSPWPTARPGTATPPTCPSTTCSPPPTTPSGAPWSARAPPTNCAPAAPAAAPRLAAHARVVATDDPGFSPMGVGEPTVAKSPTPPVPGEPEVSADGGTRGDTCHLDIVDRWGNMISATPSGGWLQSNPVVPELGFPLGTRLQMTWLEEGLPNSLTPGRRPRTTLTPSLALRDGVPVMAFGTPGGDQQDQWQLHFFLAVALRAQVRGGLDLQGAVDAPNWHNDSFPGSFYPAACGPAASPSSPAPTRR